MSNAPRTRLILAPSASACFVVLEVLNRKLFGTWAGSVDGISGDGFHGLAARDLFELPPHRARDLALAFLAFVAGANVL